MVNHFAALHLQDMASDCGSKKWGDCIQRQEKRRPVGVMVLISFFSGAPGSSLIASTSFYLGSWQWSRSNIRIIVEATLSRFPLLLFTPASLIIAAFTSIPGRIGPCVSLGRRRQYICMLVGHVSSLIRAVLGTLPMQCYCLSRDAIRVT